MPGGNTVPRLSFDNGALEYRLGGYLVRVRWEPAPVAQECGQDGVWRECWPSFRIIAPAGWAKAPGKSAEEKERTRQALLAFRRTAPPAQADLTEPFMSHQWALLTLLHDAEEMIAWARENPVLAYCVANNAEFRGIGDRAAAVA